MQRGPESKIVRQELDAEHVVRRASQTEQSELLNSEINLQEIEYAFQIIIQAQKNTYETRPRRLPIRIERIWRAFQGRQGIIVTIDDLAKQFSESKNPSGDVRPAISMINKLFEEHGIELEIKHITAYQLRRRIDK